MIWIAPVPIVSAALISSFSVLAACHFFRVSLLISLLLMANVNANAKNTDQEAQKIIAEQLKATFNQTRSLPCRCL
jgi:hypothetical protein